MEKVNEILKDLEQGRISADSASRQIVGKLEKILEIPIEGGTEEMNNGYRFAILIVITAFNE